MLFLLFSLCGNAAYAENAIQTVTLDLTNVSVKEFFAKVEEQTIYSFLYGRGIVDNKTVSVDVRDAAVEAVLSETLFPVGLTYTIKGSQIVITENRNAPLSSAPKQTGDSYTFKGVVTDCNGEPLIGANLSVKGTNVSTLTDFDGKFAINVMRGHTVLVRYLGYKACEILITGQNDLKIALDEDAAALQDVAAIGFGTQKMKQWLNRRRFLYGKDF
ncbi:MAG: carboxypeptidase-like regulatory domain-containing protein [Prevotella sp.]|nr:carboxypeptidase-like regulatory domain-containing protein [Prevotella sp.]